MAKGLEVIKNRHHKWWGRHHSDVSANGWP